MAFMRWLNQFLRPYLRDRLRPLLEGVGEAEAAVAPHVAAASIKGLGGHAGKQACKCTFSMHDGRRPSIQFQSM